MTFPYKKTLMASGKDGAIIGGTVVGGAFILKETTKIPSPIKLDAKSIVFFLLLLGGGIYIKDAMVYEKWINERINRYIS